jgi:SAM-dependent methyltransferase
MDFDELLRAAAGTSLSGWDFGVFGDRFVERSPSWDYPELAAAHLADARRAIDLGTGGGELLSSLDTLPRQLVATEGYPPNVPVAHRRLAPLGIPVVQVSADDDGRLPFRAGSVDLIINRHESYSAAEVCRVLEPGGTFLTQQVGGRDLVELNEALGAPVHSYAGWDLATAVTELDAAGMEIVDRREEFPRGELREAAQASTAQQIPQGNVTQPSHKYAPNRTDGWNATNTSNSGEAELRRRGRWPTRRRR